MLATFVQLQQCANAVLRAYCGQRDLSSAGLFFLRVVAQRLACYLCATGEVAEPLVGPGSRPLVPGYRMRMDFRRRLVGQLLSRREVYCLGYRCIDGQCFVQLQWRLGAGAGASPRLLKHESDCEFLGIQIAKAHWQNLRLRVPFCRAQNRRDSKLSDSVLKRACC